MKKVPVIIFLGITVAAMATVSPIAWESTNLAVGVIKLGEKKELTFEFTNASEEPITILDAKGSCGCTDVQYPKVSIAPGSKAAITATFSARSVGAFRKNIRIKTSTEEEYTYLYFSGEVES